MFVPNTPALFLGRNSVVAAFHFTAKFHSRGKGASAVRAAAYRAGEKLDDRRNGKTENYSRKSDVVASAILAPDGSPEWCFDREELWNQVEARENRKDAQVAQEYEINLPRELSDEDNWDLIQDFARSRLVADGRICDLSFHKSEAADGSPHPHVHILMPLRHLRDGVFAEKHEAGDWRAYFSRKDRLGELRADWCEFARRRAAELGIDLGPDWDHRSFAERGIDLEATAKIGSAGQRIAEETGKSEKLDQAQASARRNGERLLADPGIVLKALTERQSTFTSHDLARWIHRHSADDQFQDILMRAKAAAVWIGVDDLGRSRYSTKEMIELESQMLAAASRLAVRDDHRVPRPKNVSTLSEEQRAAASAILSGTDLSCLVGYAGTGKSTMLAETRAQFEGQGFRVIGGALSGIAAEKLEAGSGITSRTLASWTYGWNEGRDRLSRNDIFVLDEAGMLGTRQLSDLLTRIEKAGAKIILVGDTEQLQAIEAGAAFRGIVERVGRCELTEIWRQKESWQREATKELACGETSKALERYQSADALFKTENLESARGALIHRWAKVEGQSRIILAHTNEEVTALNNAARNRMRQDGLLGKDVMIETGRGRRAIATGDRVLFLKNDRNLGVKNGTVATVETIGKDRLAVRTDEGGRIVVQTSQYNELEYGYAVTVHKAQGLTVDHSFVLATDGFDRHLSYVAMSRHRVALSMVYTSDQFSNCKKLERTLSRERSKDLAADYVEELAMTRGLDRDAGKRERAPREHGASFQQGSASGPFWSR